MRDAHNFLFQEKNNNYTPADLDLLDRYSEYKNTQGKKDRKKVAMMLVSVNTNYWQYTGQVVEDIQKYFLPGHITDIFIWSDMQKWEAKDVDTKIREVNDIYINKKDPENALFKLVECYLKALYLDKVIDENQAILGLRRLGIDAGFQSAQGDQKNMIIKNIQENSVRVIFDATVDLLKKQKNLIETCSVFEMEPIEWPYGTLMRYSMFLQQEEKLKEYDYVFYMDVDMRIVNVVGDEILGEGLTMAEHPMYSLRREYVPPYEPNPDSTAYIPRFGVVVSEDGKPRLKPLYAAGGFQGGKSKPFLEAMKVMKENIDKDFNKNYIAIWNDESHWNKYLFDYKGPLVALSPSYVYPDSLIEEYYKKVWGRNYPPKIITLTKGFTLQKIDPNRFLNM